MSPRLALTLALVATCACVTPQGKVQAGTPMLRPKAVVAASVHDDGSLFHDAGEAERLGDHARARALYEALLREHPASPLADATRFNLGLLAEHAGDYAGAAATYSAITSAVLPTEDDARRTWIDAQFRRAACLSKVGRWEEVGAAFTTVLAVNGIPLADAIEARVGLGIANAERGDTDAAEVSFREVVGLARDFDRDSGEMLRGFAAEAAFRWGEIERARFEAVLLAFPVAVLTERLEQKCEQLLRAQRRYVRAIQLGDAHTAAAAGSRVGGLYARLHDDIVALAAPASLTSEETEVYRAEVRSRVRVLVAKAIRVYERAALAGKQTGTAARWVEESEAALARLRAIYLQDEAP